MGGLTVLPGDISFELSFDIFNRRVHRMWCHPGQLVIDEVFAERPWLLAPGDGQVVAETAREMPNQLLFFRS
jgi:hypothetical protein